jgi:hypothetical protein
MSPRPRGFIDDWTPQGATMALIDQVKTVLAEYRDQLPLTLGQIFYRLVGAYEYEKTEKAYKRLTEAMDKARRARLIRMDDIRDDGFTSQLSLYFHDVDDFFDDVRSMAEDLRLDRQKRPSAPSGDLGGGLRYGSANRARGRSVRHRGDELGRL